MAQSIQFAVRAPLDLQNEALENVSGLDLQDGATISGTVTFDDSVTFDGNVSFADGDTIDLSNANINGLVVDVSALADGDHTVRPGDFIHESPTTWAWKPSSDTANDTITVVSGAITVGRGTSWIAIGDGTGLAALTQAGIEAAITDNAAFRTSIGVVLYTDADVARVANTFVAPTNLLIDGTTVSISSNNFIVGTGVAGGPAAAGFADNSEYLIRLSGAVNGLAAGDYIGTVLPVPGIGTTGVGNQSINFRNLRLVTTGFQLTDTNIVLTDASNLGVASQIFNFERTIEGALNYRAALPSRTDGAGDFLHTPTADDSIILFNQDGSVRYNTISGATGALTTDDFLRMGITEYDANTTYMAGDVAFIGTTAGTFQIWVADETANADTTGVNGPGGSSNRWTQVSFGGNADTVTVASTAAEGAGGLPQRVLLADGPGTGQSIESTVNLSFDTSASELEIGTSTAQTGKLRLHSGDGATAEQLILESNTHVVNEVQGGLNLSASESISNTNLVTSALNLNVQSFTTLALAEAAGLAAEEIIQLTALDGTNQPGLYRRTGANAYTALFTIGESGGSRVNPHAMTIPVTNGELPSTGSTTRTHDVENVNDYILDDRNRADGTGDGGTLSLSSAAVTALGLDVNTPPTLSNPIITFPYQQGSILVSIIHITGSVPFTLNGDGSGTLDFTEDQWITPDTDGRTSFNLLVGFGIQRAVVNYTFSIISNDNVHGQAPTQFIDSPLTVSADGLDVLYKGAEIGTGGDRASVVIVTTDQDPAAATQSIPAGSIAIVSAVNQYYNDANAAQDVGPFADATAAVTFFDAESTFSRVGDGDTGVSRIIAGTNVTISPTGGTGDVTINASGTGGGDSRYDFAQGDVISFEEVVDGAEQERQGSTGSIILTMSPTSTPGYTFTDGDSATSSRPRVLLTGLTPTQVSDFTSDAPDNRIMFRTGDRRYVGIVDITDSTATSVAVDLFYYGDDVQNQALTAAEFNFLYGARPSDTIDTDFSGELLVGELINTAPNVTIYTGSDGINVDADNLDISVDRAQISGLEVFTSTPTPNPTTDGLRIDLDETGTGSGLELTSDGLKVDVAADGGLEIVGSELRLSTTSAPADSFTHTNFNVSHTVGTNADGSTGTYDQLFGTTLDPIDDTTGVDFDETGTLASDITVSAGIATAGNLLDDLLESYKTGARQVSAADIALIDAGGEYGALIEFLPVGQDLVGLFFVNDGSDVWTMNNGLFPTTTTLPATTPYRLRYFSTNVPVFNNPRHVPYAGVVVSDDRGEGEIDSIIELVNGNVAPALFERFEPTANNLVVTTQYTDTTIAVAEKATAVTKRRDVFGFYLDIEIDTLYDTTLGQSFQYNPSLESGSNGITLTFEALDIPRDRINSASVPGGIEVDGELIQVPGVLNLNNTEFVDGVLNSQPAVVGGVDTITTHVIGNDGLPTSRSATITGVALNAAAIQRLEAGGGGGGDHTHTANFYGFYPYPGSVSGIWNNDIHGGDLRGLGTYNNNTVNPAFSQHIVQAAGAQNTSINNFVRSRNYWNRNVGTYQRFSTQFRPLLRRDVAELRADGETSGLFRRLELLFRRGHIDPVLGVQGIGNNSQPGGTGFESGVSDADAADLIYQVVPGVNTVDLFLTFVTQDTSNNLLVNIQHTIGLSRISTGSTTDTTSIASHYIIHNPLPFDIGTNRAQAEFINMQVFWVSPTRNISGELQSSLFRGFGIAQPGNSIQEVGVNPIATEPNAPDRSTLTSDKLFLYFDQPETVAAIPESEPFLINMRWDALDATSISSLLSLNYNPFQDGAGNSNPEGSFLNNIITKGSVSGTAQNELVQLDYASLGFDGVPGTVPITDAQLTGLKQRLALDLTRSEDVARVEPRLNTAGTVDELYLEGGGAGASISTLLLPRSEASYPMPIDDSWISADTPNDNEVLTWNEATQTIDWESASAAVAGVSSVTLNTDENTRDTIPLSVSPTTGDVVINIPQFRNANTQLLQGAFAGIVPGPPSVAAREFFLRGDGTWVGLGESAGIPVGVIPRSGGSHFEQSVISHNSVTINSGTLFLNRVFSLGAPGDPTAAISANGFLLSNGPTSNWPGGNVFLDITNVDQGRGIAAGMYLSTSAGNSGSTFNSFQDLRLVTIADDGQVTLGTALDLTGQSGPVDFDLAIRPVAGAWSETVTINSNLTDPVNGNNDIVANLVVEGNITAGSITAPLNINSLTGDILADDDSTIVLENGTNGTDAFFRGNVRNGDNTIVLTVGDDSNAAVLTGNVTGNVTGDIISSEGTTILDNGTNGTDATFAGNANTATTLATPRTIAIDTPALTGGAITGIAQSFDGSNDITIMATVDDAAISIEKLADGVLPTFTEGSNTRIINNISVNAEGNLVIGDDDLNTDDLIFVGGGAGTITGVRGILPITVTTDTMLTGGLVVDVNNFSQDAKGTVPGPTNADINNNAFLRADGDWQIPLDQFSSPITNDVPGNPTTIQLPGNATDTITLVVNEGLRWVSGQAVGFSFLHGTGGQFMASFGGVVDAYPVAGTTDQIRIRGPFQFISDTSALQQTDLRQNVMFNTDPDQNIFQLGAAGATGLQGVQGAQGISIGPGVTDDFASTLPGDAVTVMVERNDPLNPGTTLSTIDFTVQPGAVGAKGDVGARGFIGPFTVSLYAELAGVTANFVQTDITTTYPIPTNVTFSSTSNELEGLNITDQPPGATAELNGDWSTQRPAVINNDIFVIEVVVTQVSNTGVDDDDYNVGGFSGVFRAAAQGPAGSQGPVGPNGLDGRDPELNTKIAQSATAGITMINGTTPDASDFPIAFRHTITITSNVNGDTGRDVEGTVTLTSDFVGDNRILLQGNAVRTAGTDTTPTTWEVFVIAVQDTTTDVLPDGNSVQLAVAGIRGLAGAAGSSANVDELFITPRDITNPDRANPIHSTYLGNKTDRFLGTPVTTGFTTPQTLGGVSSTVSQFDTRGFSWYFFDGIEFDGTNFIAGGGLWSTQADLTGGILPTTIIENLIG